MRQRRRSWIPTLSFFPILYLLGWILAQPFRLLPFIQEQNKLDLLGTFFTFGLFLILLPSWAEFRWKKQETWLSLGLGFVNKTFFYKTYLKGLIMAVALIFFILIPIFYGRWVEFADPLGFTYLLNAIFLGLVVGFAEELIFRGWLWNEANLLLGPIWGIPVQAMFFSFSHIIAFLKLDLGLFELIALLFGLFLLGLVLGIRRILDNGSISGCIGLHGGLVGLWFFINVDIIDISKTTPTWLIGPGRFSPNPIGSFTGILCLLLILFFYRTALANAGRPSNGARNASSRGAIP